MINLKECHVDRPNLCYALSTRHLAPVRPTALTFRRGQLLQINQLLKDQYSNTVSLPNCGSKSCNSSSGTWRIHCSCKPLVYLFFSFRCG